MKKLISTLVAGVVIGFGGCSLNNLNLEKKQDYSLENILPNKYKSMDLRYLGTVKRQGAGDSYKTNQNEFVVTSFYKNKDRKSHPTDNLVMKFQKADYDLMVVYQVCDGNIENKKPIMIYAPHGGEKGSKWIFQKNDSFGAFYNMNDLMAKFNHLKGKDLSEKIKPTFANCGRKIKIDENMQHHNQRDHHGARKHSA